MMVVDFLNYYAGVYGNGFVDKELVEERGQDRHQEQPGLRTDILKFPTQSQVSLPKASFRIVQGDIRDVASTLPEVDCVVTSPPYFQQRRYGSAQEEIGREHSVEEYIASLVDIFNSLRLCSRASLWVNIADKRRGGELLGIPHRFVLAMQEHDWRLVDDVVWAKQVVKEDGSTLGNSMIEPAPGRLNGHWWEPFLRFVRNPDMAWSDTSAVRIPRANVSGTPYSSNMRCVTQLQGRNCGNVWHIAGARTSGHYASFPRAIVERPIAMTCPEEVTSNGPRYRIEEAVYYDDGRHVGRRLGQYTQSNNHLSGRQDTGRAYIARYPQTIGWSDPEMPTIRRGLVLDPFAGTGTTGEVALSLGRDFVGVELYPEYISMMERKLASAVIFDVNPGDVPDRESTVDMFYEEADAA